MFQLVERCRPVVLSMNGMNLSIAALSGTSAQLPAGLLDSWVLGARPAICRSALHDCSSAQFLRSDRSRSPITKLKISTNRQSAMLVRYRQTWTNSSISALTGKRCVGS